MRIKLAFVTLIAFVALLGLQGMADTVSAKVCPVTRPTEDKPSNANTARYSRYWYRSPDGKIFASGSGRLFAGSNKILWERPPESQFVITGHRLDDPSIRLNADLPQGYEAADFQPSGLSFPIGGCWQIEARAGDSSLTFVVEVLPRAYRYVPYGCPDLAYVVAISDLIFYGTVVGSTPADKDFEWRTIRPIEYLKGSADDDPYLDILHDSMYDEPMQQGQTYLFFLKAIRGSPWKMICGHRLNRVVDGRIQGSVWDEKIDTIEALRARIKAIQK